LTLFISNFSVGFYDDVSQVSDAEERLYDPIISWMQRFVFY